MNAEQKQRALTALGMWHSNNDGSLREYQAAELMASLLQELVDAPEAEPFGYFKSEPFGWTDCAETDDGAIALYTAPPEPSVPDGWIRAIDEAMVVHHIGIADRADGYEEAKKKLNELLAINSDIARYCSEPPADVARDAALYCAVQRSCAALLQELVDAPATEPVARVTGYYAGYLSIATVDGRVLPAGTALYTAPPHQSEHHLEMVNTPAPSVPDAELVTVPRELLGAASYAIKKNLPAPKILEQLRRYALGGVAAPTPAPSVPDVANTFKRRAEEIVAMAVNRENYAKINRTIADLVTDIANAAEAPTPAEVLTTTNQAQTSSSQVEAPESEPFGYFKAEPFGWTDCAETDDGAIALYTAPPAPSVLDGWRSAIAKEFPLYDEDGLDEDKHCCEWVMLQERKRLHKMLAAPTPPKLSDERILEICGFRPESAAEIGADIVRKRWLEIARAIEREILGGSEK